MDGSSDFRIFLQSLRNGQTLSMAQAENVVTRILDGSVSPAQIGAFLMALSVRGETTQEIAGAARSLRSRASTLQAPEGAVDCCGTGGDHSGTFNISTAVALVSAACGVPVAKHGNRAASSKSGAADVLEELGVSLEASVQTLERALKTIGFCFLMAPRHHAAMKHVAEIRKELGFRTLFNMLGPLANPASVNRQLIGVAAESWIDRMAGALVALGSECAWVVHGSDGLDEITLTGPTYVAIVEKGSFSRRTLTPADFGLSPVRAQDLHGGDAVENARIIRRILSGEKGAHRDIVLANAAAVLAISGQEAPLPDLVVRAAESIDSGQALSILETYATVSRS